VLNKKYTAHQQKRITRANRKKNIDTNHPYHPQPNRPSANVAYILQTIHLLNPTKLYFLVVFDIGLHHQRPIKNLHINTQPNHNFIHQKRLRKTNNFPHQPPHQVRNDKCLGTVKATSENLLTSMNIIDNKDKKWKLHEPTTHI